MALFPISFGISKALARLFAPQSVRRFPSQLGWGSFGNLGFRRIGGGKIPY